MSYYNTTGPSSYPPCSGTMGQCPCSYGGCMDPTASNYDANATCDDGSCIAVVSGCMDPAADNYNPNANVDDGGCLYNTGNTYNNGNLVCWNDACPSPSQITPGTATTCPSTHPFPTPPVCPTPVYVVISLSNFVGIYNPGECGSTDITIANMPPNSTWVVKRNPWSPNMGVIASGNYLNPQASVSNLCEGNYVISVYSNNNLIQSKAISMILPSSQPAIEVVSTTNTSPPSCDGEVKFKIRQQCHPIAPPWGNCNMSFSNRSTFRIKDSTNNIVVNSAGQSWGENGLNAISGSFVYNLKASGSSITYAGGTKSRSWMNINLCPGNYTLELVSSGSGAVIETTTFNIQ